MAMNRKSANPAAASACTAISRIGSGSPPSSRQRGIALLALLALLLLVGAGVLIQRVNARVEFNPQFSSKTGEVLKQAKSALIARAVIDSNRPGELPCPDVDYDGSVIMNKDFTGGTNIPCSSLLGWLPWRTLDLPELRDASGARLWYALSDAWHAGHSQELNPDTTGGLTLNGSANPDIVAVIIAPGADLQPDTDPRPDETSTAMNATSPALVQKFLESTNSDGTATTYVNQAVGSFNDRMVVITRAELIAAVQRRVAGELAVALSDYRATNGRYPWLSNNTDPMATNPPLLDGIPGVRNGHIAYIDPTLTVPETYLFQSGFTVSWSRDKDKVNDVKDHTTKLDIDTSASAWGSPGEDPLVDAVRDALDALGINPVPDTIKLYVLDDDKDKMKDGVKDALNNDSPQTVAMPATALAGATCDWQNDAGRVDCDYALTTPAPYGSVALCIKGDGFDVCPSALASQVVNRTMFLNLHYLGTQVTSATSGARTRDVQSPNGSFQSSPSGTTTIRFTDKLDSPFDIFFATRALIPADNDDADFNTVGIYAEPQSGGSLPGDLPAWFADNNWGPYLYVSYAASFIPTGSGACMVGTDCLNLSVADSLSRNDIESVVVSSGVAVGGQVRVAGAALPQFFEEDNANGNDNVERKTVVNAFNDYVRLVACATGPATDCR